MILQQTLVEVLDREALVALAVERLHLLGAVARNPPARRLAEPLVQKPRLALLIVPVAPAPKCPLAHSKQLRRLLLIQLRRLPAAPPEGLPSGASKPSQKGQTYRTDRALPTSIFSADCRVKESVIFVYTKVKWLSS